MSVGLVMSDERRAWGSVPMELHRIVLEEYERTGAVPSAGILAELAEMNPTLVRRTLKQLCEEGLLVQPHGERSPYVPLYRPDGARVKPKLVVVDSEGEEQVSDTTGVDLKQVSTEELLAEALRRAQESGDK